VWPGMAIFLTVIVFNFLGDGLQEALNHKGARD
jgi:ABC-type dipeptide/oligopeptide/nickel transport system permease subunit